MTSNIPQTGRELFAWAKDQEQFHGVGLVKYLAAWGKLNDFAGRIVEWDAELTALAYQECLRRLRSTGAIK